MVPPIELKVRHRANRFNSIIPNKQFANENIIEPITSETLLIWLWLAHSAIINLAICQTAVIIDFCVQLVDCSIIGSDGDGGGDSRDSPSLHGLVPSFCATIKSRSQVNVISLATYVS